MRICYLGDAGSVLIRMRVGHFAQRGHDVHLISFRRGEIEECIPHYIRPPIPFASDLSYILSIPKIRRLVRHINPEIVHAYYVTSYGFIGSCCDFRPLIVSCIGCDILNNPQESIFHKWLTKYTLREATFITSVSRPMTERIIKLGIEPQKIQTFPFGVDPEKFFPAYRESKELALLSLRSLEPIYNIKTILEGFSYLIEEGFRGRLIVVGEGPEEKKLKKRAQDLGISDHVNFMGTVHHDKVAEYLRASQIYLSMSLSDGASTSLLEAMACGIYPIVSDIPANREWIQDGDNGFLVPVRDAETLAQRIKEACSNTELRRRGVVKNLKIVKERGNFPRNMALLEELYKEVVRKNRG